MSATAPRTTAGILDRLRQAARRLGPPAAPPAEVTDYDWTRPHHFTASGHRQLDAFAYRLQRRMSTALAHVLETGRGVVADPPEECYPGAVDDGDPACYVPLRDANDTPCGALRFPSSLAAVWVERLLGGTPSARSRGTDLSPLEAGLLLDIASWMTQAVSEVASAAGTPDIHHEPTVTGWAEALPTDAGTELCLFRFREADAAAVATRPSRTHTASSDAAAADADATDRDTHAPDGDAAEADASNDDENAEAAFADGSLPDADEAGGTDGAAGGDAFPPPDDAGPAPTVILASRFAEPLAETEPGLRPAPPDPNAFYHAVRARIEATPVTVQADLGTVSVPLCDFLSLEPGDVLVLDRHRSGTIDLAVDGHVVLKARPAVAARQYAVEVQDLRRHSRLELPT